MIRFLFTTIFCVMFTTSMAYAHDGADKCGNTKSTADLLQCLNLDHEKQKEALNAAFTEALNDLEPEQAVTMKEAQNAWVAYRDLECAFEGESSENASLSRVVSLRCLSKLTKERTDIITGTEQKQPDSQLGVLPRWMNVLGDKYPNVTWNYAERIEGDFDCDESNEYAMAGIKTTEEGVQSTVIAFAESATTGKPKTRILDLPMESGICDPNLTLSLKTKDNIEELAPESCSVYLDITDGQCYHVHAMAGDVGYILGKNLLAPPPPSPAEKPESQGVEK